MYKGGQQFGGNMLDEYRIEVFYTGFPFGIPLYTEGTETQLPLFFMGKEAVQLPLMIQKKEKGDKENEGE
jgi:hypothetical protein